MGYLLIELITVIPLMIIVIYFVMKPLKVTRKFDPMKHFKDVIDERLDRKEIVNKVQPIYVHVAIDTMLMNAYLRDCYADSTEATYDWYEHNGVKYRTGISFDPGFTMGYIGRWSVYNHKQPTFEGYVEWLNNLFIDAIK